MISAPSSTNRAQSFQVVPGILIRMFFCVILLVVAFASASQAGAAPATTTSLAITSGGNPVTTVVSGSVVTLTATVVAGSATIGQVNFCDATATFCSGTHLIGTAQLTSGGTATFKFVPRLEATAIKRFLSAREPTLQALRLHRRSRSLPQPESNPLRPLSRKAEARVISP